MISKLEKIYWDMGTDTDKAMVTEINTDMVNMDMDIMKNKYNIYPNKPFIVVCYAPKCSG